MRGVAWCRGSGYSSPLTPSCERTRLHMSSSSARRSSPSSRSAHKSVLHEAEERVPRISDCPRECLQQGRTICTVQRRGGCEFSGAESQAAEASMRRQRSAKRGQRQMHAEAEHVHELLHGQRKRKTSYSTRLTSAQWLFRGLHRSIIDRASSASPPLCLLGRARIRATRRTRTSRGRARIASTTTRPTTTSAILRSLPTSRGQSSAETRSPSRGGCAPAAPSSRARPTSRSRPNPHVRELLSRLLSQHTTFNGCCRERSAVFQQDETKGCSPVLDRAARTFLPGIICIPADASAHACMKHKRDCIFAALLTASSGLAGAVRVQRGRRAYLYSFAVKSVGFRSLKERFVRTQF